MLDIKYMILAAESCIVIIALGCTVTAVSYLWNLIVEARKLLRLINGTYGPTINSIDADYLRKLDSSGMLIAILAVVSAITLLAIIMIREQL